MGLTLLLVGAVLAIIGWSFGVPVLWWIGLAMVVAGGVLAVVDAARGRRI